MKVVRENFKRIISFRIIVIIISLIPIILIPICTIIFNLNLFSENDEKNEMESFLFVTFSFSLIFFFHIKLPHNNIQNLFKLNSLLKYGIYTKAKIIKIIETKKQTTFYFKLMHPKYKNIVVQETISFFIYHKRHKIVTNEIFITKDKNLHNQANHTTIVKPKISLKEDNIYNYNEYHHLKKNSIVSILYDPSNNECMYCPFWDVWKRNHWLDDYTQDNIGSKESCKQRTISKSKLFKNILKIQRIIIIIALIILAGTLSYKNIFPIIAIIECWLFLMWSVFSHYYFKRHHDFYEYSVATTGTITSCTEITERKREQDFFDEYHYTFTTPNGIPYQGIMKVNSSRNIRPYSPGSSATILYDPYCIAQNCLAFYYPYSWIQPEETKNFYKISITQPEYTNDED